LHVPLTGLACTCAGNLDRAISAGRFKNPDGTPNMVRASRALEHRPLVSAGAGACWAGVACLSPARLSLSRALRSGPPDASAAGAAQVTVCRCLIDIANGMDYLHSLGVLHAGARWHCMPHLTLSAYTLSSCNPLVACACKQALRMQLSSAWCADLKGGNVLLKSTSIHDDPRGFICKARSAHSPCLKGCRALGRGVLLRTCHRTLPCSC